MKRIDYFFLIYSLVLLLFGFDDDPHPERQNAASSSAGLQYRSVAASDQLPSRDQIVFAIGSDPITPTKSPGVREEFPSLESKRNHTIKPRETVRYGTRSRSRQN